MYFNIRKRILKNDFLKMAFHVMYALEMVSSTWESFICNICDSYQEINLCQGLQTSGYLLLVNLEKSYFSSYTLLVLQAYNTKYSLLSKMAVMAELCLFHPQIDMLKP
jgi:hypothetical protein